MARISADQIGLRDAADVFGVSIDTLRRRIRDNQLDEALLVQGPFGATWVLPKADLVVVAERENWDLEVEPDGSVSREASGGQAPAPIVQTSTPPAAVPVPSLVIDLTDDPTYSQPSPGAAIAVQDSPRPVTSEVQDLVEATVARVTESVSHDLSAGISEEIAKGLAQNVQAELTAVREAITAAEVKVVAADARNDALRADKGRLEAQVKRGEADIEYWRSQHDRLDKDLDRERSLRVASDKAKSIAESETRVVRERVAELTVDLADTQDRERGLIAVEASLQSELDQATMAMGWWSRRRLLKLQARSSVRNTPPPLGE